MGVSSPQHLAVVTDGGGGQTDTLCITPAHTQPVPSWIESAWEDVDMKAAYSDRIDVSQYTGNKPVSSNGQKRLRAFLDWVFSEDNDLYDTIIVAGPIPCGLGVGVPWCVRPTWIR